MEVSSSTDNQDIRDISGELTYLIFALEIDLEGIKTALKEINQTVRIIKENTNNIHGSGDQSRIEDLLCFRMVIEKLSCEMKSMSSQMENLNSEIQQAMNN